MYTVKIQYKNSQEQFFKFELQRDAKEIFESIRSTSKYNFIVLAPSHYFKPLEELYAQMLTAF